MRLPSDFSSSALDTEIQRGYDRKLGRKWVIIHDFYYPKGYDSKIKTHMFSLKALIEDIL